MNYPMNRRHFMKHMAGAAALTVAGQNFVSNLNAAAPALKKAGKHLVMLYMGGGPSHIDTWDIKVALLDPADLLRKSPPEVKSFPKVSTERAELEHFAAAAAARRPIAVPGGDEVHNVAVLEAIVRSAREGARVKL